MVAVAIAVVAVSAVTPGAPGREDAALRCASGQDMVGVGWVCPQSNGLLEVFGAQGESLGFTHGPDDVDAPADEGEASAGSSPRSPTCVSGAPGTYYIQVIYARASNDQDEYAAKVEAIRDIVASANGLVNDAAHDTGGRIHLKVKCVSGVVHVANEALPTSRTSDSFSTITGDLRNRGYNDGKVKYWVFYDDSIGGLAAGQGNVNGDDRLTASNANNGNSGPMFAITYGGLSVRVMLHELGHILGAVQNSSPHASGGFHCWDGTDIMCYNDAPSGPKGALYTTIWCAEEVWDCNHDDYFHFAPPSGNYLVDHWNLASPLSRYIDFPDPTVPEVELLVCDGYVGINTPAKCTFRAADDSAGVAYNLDWGDGATQRVPAVGFVSPGSDLNATHAYAADGTYAVRVTATDNGSPAKTSSALSFPVRAIEDTFPPNLVVLAPLADHLYSGCDVRIRDQVGQTPARYATEGCIWANADDFPAGIASVSAYFDGQLVGTLNSAPFIFEFPVTGPATAREARIVAVDNLGNTATATQSVDVIA